MVKSRARKFADMFSTSLANVLEGGQLDKTAVGGLTGVEAKADANAATIGALHTVATSGDYGDLINKPPTGFEPHATEPAVGAGGTTYYNTTTNEPFFSNGTVWVSFTNLAAEPTSGTASISVQANSAMPSRNLDNDFTDDEITTALTYAVSSGSLPSGVSISGNLLQGTPTTAGTYNFEIEATDTGGLTSTPKSYSFVVTPDTVSATGGTVTTSGGYKYHKFTSSGTFTVTGGGGEVEYLVVAGGGGGGAGGGGSDGGGGAGGFRTNVSGATSGGGASAEAAMSLTAGSYSVTVGAGGAAVTTGAGNQGSNSTFNGITSIGGGAGGGGDGGSGGGGPSSGGANRAGNGTSGQGYAGGFRSLGGYASSGGGGAGGVGGTPTGNPDTNAKAGAGGSGQQSSITGSPIYYAGGGGGADFSAGGPSYGRGGVGGGGGGAYNYRSGTGVGNGTVNTGGGGGGAGTTTSGAGGSGIVIIRYAT